MANTNVHTQCCSYLPRMPIFVEPTASRVCQMHKCKSIKKVEKVHLDFMLTFYFRLVKSNIIFQKCKMLKEQINETSVRRCVAQSALLVYIFFVRFQAYVNQSGLKKLGLNYVAHLGLLVTSRAAISSPVSQPSRPFGDR